MILDDILSILQNDVDLQLLLNGTTTDKKIYAFNTSKLNSIVYDYIDLTSNKIIGQSRLTLTINTLKVDYYLNMQIVNKVKQLLLTLADKQFNNKIMEIQQNGGGILTNEETNTIHNKLIL
mgnify:FL=1